MYAYNNNRTYHKMVVSMLMALVTNALKIHKVRLHQKAQARSHYHCQHLQFLQNHVSTSEIDCLERRVSEMTCYVSSGTLNLHTHSRV